MKREWILDPYDPDTPLAVREEIMSGMQQEGECWPNESYHEFDPGDEFLDKYPTTVEYVKRFISGSETFIIYCHW